MNHARLKTALSVVLVSLSLQVFAESSTPQTNVALTSPNADLNYQNDYICNAKVGNVITSGTLDFASTNQHRFGFTYPVKVNTVWVKEDGQASWHRYELESKPNFAAYKGIRLELHQKTSGCQTGEIATRIADNVKKEAMISADLCASEPLNTAQVQILFEAIN